MALIGGWLISHVPRRDEHFTLLRGPSHSADVGPEAAHARGFVSRAARVTSSTGLAVNLRVLRPAGSGPAQRVPLVILLGGQRTGRDAIDVVGDPGAIAVAALDYPYHGPERPRGVGQSLRAIPAAQDALLDTPPAVSVALDWLLTQPWVDPDRVELMGVSLGVPFAAVAGAHDGRFRRVWLIHGGVDNQAWLAQRLESRIGSPFLRNGTASLLHLLAYGSSFRTEDWVPRIAPRRVVIIGADTDEQMPPARVEALFAAAREPKELLWSKGGHVSTKRHDIVQQLLAMVRTRIEREQTEQTERARTQH